MAKRRSVRSTAKRGSNARLAKVSKERNQLKKLIRKLQKQITKTKRDAAKKIAQAKKSATKSRRSASRKTTARGRRSGGRLGGSRRRVRRVKSTMFM